MEKINTKPDNVILERLAIIIDILMIILNCSYSDAYSLITSTKTYYYLLQKDYGTMHDSPQANLSSIGSDLRESNTPVGNYITDENIKKAMLIMRSRNKTAI